MENKDKKPKTREVKLEAALANLIDLAKTKNNKLSSDEVIDKCEKYIIDPEDIDEMHKKLNEAGIVVEELTLEEKVSLDKIMGDGITDDNVKMYLKDIGSVPLLTPEEERNLAIMMASENEADCQYAKNRLSEANLRLVVSIAKKYVGRGMQFLDLIQEGNLGLMKAQERLQIKQEQSESLCIWWKQSTKQIVLRVDFCKSLEESLQRLKSLRQWDLLRKKLPKF